MSSGGFISVLWFVASCGSLFSTCCGYRDFAPYMQGEEQDLYLYPEADSQSDFELSKRQNLSPAELHAILSELTPEKIKELTQKGEFRYVALLERPQSSFTPRLGRRKRNLDYGHDDEELFQEHSDNDEIEESFRLFQLLNPAMIRRNGNVKTIHLQSSFVPRLGRKRSDENVSDLDSSTNSQGNGISGRSQHVVNLSAGSAFTPRLGRSGNARPRHQQSSSVQGNAQRSN